MPHEIIHRFSLETLLESTTDSVGAVDADLRTIFANAAFRRLYQEVAGRDLKEGAPITDRWEEPARTRYEALYRRALGGESFVVELELPRASAQPASFSIRLSPIQGPDGIVGVVTVARDVSQQRREEATLRSIARGVAETAGSAFFRSLVARLTEALGVRLAFIGRLKPGEAGVVASVAVQQESAPGDAFEFSIAGTPCERVLLEPGAPHFFTHCVASCFPPQLRQMGLQCYCGIALVNSTGQPIGVLAVADTRLLSETERIGSVLEIFAARAAAELERLNQQEELEHSRASLATLLEHLPIAVASTDRDFRLEAFNGQLSRLFAAFSDRPVSAGAPLAHWLEAERWERWQDMFARAASQGHAFSRDRIRNADGTERLLDLMVNAVRHLDQVTGYVLHAHDVTARASLDAELRRSERLEATARLAGGIAHDFNNVLAVIQSTARNELLELREDDPLRRSLADISAACETAGRVTRELFALARQQDLRLSALDVRDVVEQLQRVLRRVAGNRADVVLELGDSPVMACTDGGQLERVLLNLVGNARDALPAGGRIEVAVQRRELDAVASARLPGTLPGTWVELRVSDDGTGIHADVLPHLFDPFFTTKPLGEGTGMGLASTYGIVRQLGGCITVESELGRGSTFRVFLPEASGDPAHEEAVEPTAASPTHAAPSVLVVDDDPAVRSLIAAMLKQSGSVVLAAADGNEALRLLAAHGEPVQVLVADVLLPDGSGPEVAAALRLRCPEIETLFMSGYTREVLASSGFESRGVAFIAKPFARDELVTRVREVADAHARKVP